MKLGHNLRRHGTAQSTQLPDQTQQHPHESGSSEKRAARLLGSDCPASSNTPIFIWPARAWFFHHDPPRLGSQKHGHFCGSFNPSDGCAHGSRATQRGAARPRGRSEWGSRDPAGRWPNARCPGGRTFLAGFSWWSARRRRDVCSAPRTAHELLRNRVQTSRPDSRWVLHSKFE